MTTNSTKEVKLTRSIVFVFFASSIRWLLGYIRIAIIAFLFGATFTYDAYLVAFTIPEMIAGLLVGIIAVTFIPIFTDHLFKDGEESAWDFASNLINIFFIVGLFLTLLALMLAPFIIKIVAPGFNKETSRIAIRLLTIISPIVLIVTLSELMTQILHAYRYFTIPALSKILEVVVVIICLIFLYKLYGIMSLATGILLGAIVRLGFQIPLLRKKFKYYRFNLDFKLPGVKKVNLIAGPAIFCMLFLRIGVMIERLLASTLGNGAISILGYAATLSHVPAEFFIGSLAVVLFPLISNYVTEGKLEDFKAILSKGIKIGNFILIPIAVLFIFFGKQIIQLLLERGQFTSSVTQDTSIALAIYALGLFAMTTFFFSAQACYALQEVKATIKIAVLVMVLNIILKLILVNYFSFAGLALATSIALIVQSGLLIRFVRKRIGPIAGKEIAFSSIKVLGASILMAGVCWLALRFIPVSSSYLIQFILLIITASVSYLVISYFLRSQELAAVKDLLKKMVTSSA